MSMHIHKIRNKQQTNQAGVTHTHLKSKHHECGYGEEYSYEFASQVLCHGCLKHCHLCAGVFNEGVLSDDVYFALHMHQHTIQYNNTQYTVSMRIFSSVQQCAANTYIDEPVAKNATNKRCTPAQMHFFVHQLYNEISSLCVAAQYMCR